MRMKGEKEAQGGGRIWQEGIPLLKEEGGCAIKKMPRSLL